ncbi:MAG TPA: folylpolyglutamate synthase/dihydrofolate synthase family protein [Chthoniobacteraceae bacterium]
MNYEEALQWLYGTQLHGIRLGLESIRRLTEALEISVDGRSGPKFLHVAGTNGKGSTCAMLDSLCRAAGLRTGLFTSPHLITFRERIQVDGDLISEAEVADGLTSIREAVADWEHSPTFFEITTALALGYFQYKQVEVAVLETGMGGRLDATNIVTPAVSIVTEIDLDHQQWLGSTLAEIAAEKAGIAKAGVPFITVPQQREARLVLSHLAVERDAPFCQVATPLNDVDLGLAGSHQEWNAALAVHALELAGIAISGDTIVAGLRNVNWPGRFQRWSDQIILDGAHNPAASARLVETWREIFGPEQATIVLAVMRDKNVRGVCEALRPLAVRVITVEVGNDRSCTAQELAETFAEVAPGAEISAAAALDTALTAAQQFHEKVLITGSLFLVGEVLARFQTGSSAELSSQ